MSIQWYPGHMHKASKEIRKMVSQVDLIIEILDARIPFSSDNPMLEKIRRDKPCIKLLNKADLADPSITAAWQQHLESSRGIKTMATSIQQPGKIRQVPGLIEKMLSARRDKGRMLQAMITGIPNVGKSSLINLLAGRAIADTGNEPAITRSQQRIKIASNIMLHDTPGVLWPKIENANSGYRLAITGAIKDTATDNQDLAFFAAEFLLASHPDRLLERYQWQEAPTDADDLLQQLARRRGCLRAGGHVDYDKVSKLLLTDLRGGALGRISLETPEMVNQELASENSRC